MAKFKYFPFSHALTASNTKSVKKISNSAVRDITKFNPSSAISSAASVAHLFSWKMRCAIRAVKYTVKVPATATAIRHPNSWLPNNLMPMAISHFPTGGWTMNSGAPLVTSTPNFK